MLTPDCIILIIILLSKLPSFILKSLDKTLFDTNSKDDFIEVLH